MQCARKLEEWSNLKKGERAVRVVTMQATPWHGLSSTKWLENHEVAKLCGQFQPDLKKDSEQPVDRILFGPGVPCDYQKLNNSLSP